jgi:cation:H+ antiporter
MEAAELYIAQHVWVACLVLAASFLVLARSADIFVESAVALAYRLRIPKLVIGIVLVSLATTAPELAVSLVSALKGNPEMALGNAIGSVICDDGLALALAGLLCLAPIPVLPRVLKTSGLFLIFIQIVTFLFVVGDYTLDRWEGGMLVGLFACYLGMLYHQHAKGHLHDPLDVEPETVEAMSLARMVTFFVLGLGGIILASEFIVVSATTVATAAGVPKSVIALTLVAFGTSIPEVATCVASARKGHGAIAVGNIIGADVMNICWVAGASALANPLTLGTTPAEGARQVYFMFPAMFLVVGAMLLLLRIGHNLNRWKGGVLLGLYVVYLVVSVLFFR